MRRYITAVALVALSACELHAQVNSEPTSADPWGDRNITRTMPDSWGVVCYQHDDQINPKFLSCVKVCAPTPAPGYPKCPGM